MLLSHESMMSYYTDNNKMLFRIRGEFEQHMTLTELENMLPYERSIYFILINQRIEQRRQEKGIKRG